MKRLGKITGVTRDGLIVVSSSIKDPRRKVGQRVYDENGNLLGKIIDVIGRVDSPYIIVKSNEKQPLVEVGAQVYYREIRRRRKGRGRRGGKTRRRR